MNEAKFTKGEWVIREACEYHGDYIESLDGTVCDAYFMRGDTINHHPNHKANTHLIAAAPNHDAALVMISEKLPVTPKVFGGDYMITLTQEEVNQIRKSLAKARGEE